VYYIFDTKEGVSRGFYVHRNLKQFAICVTGGCRFILNNGNNNPAELMDFIEALEVSLGKKAEKKTLATSAWQCT
jgi:hypothetical protein